MSLRKKSIADLRVNYALGTLDEKKIHQDPFKQFEKWMAEAIKAKVNEPNAMTLATVKSDGSPDARVVLLKGLNRKGFVFYTNYESRKAIEMAQNPNVAVVFCWLELHRQVRIEGIVSRVSARESDAYFKSRPRESQIGAYVSPQSSTIRNRKYLEDRYQMFKEKFHKGILKRPDYWGGYLIEPKTFEFWQGRESRLHDRLQYSKTPGRSAWVLERLAP